jgi:hypothetical protein
MLHIPRCLEVPEKFWSLSHDNEKPLVGKALIALDSIFDQLGSERGAQILISGAVAGLVGAVGWSAEATYLLSLAAWSGKDAFQEAVRAIMSQRPPPKRRTKSAQK